MRAHFLPRKIVRGGKNVVVSILSNRPTSTFVWEINGHLNSLYHNAATVTFSLESFSPVLHPGLLPNSCDVLLFTNKHLVLAQYRANGGQHQPSIKPALSVCRGRSTDISAYAINIVMGRLWANAGDRPPNPCLPAVSIVPGQCWSDAGIISYQYPDDALFEMAHVS